MSLIRAIFVFLTVLAASPTHANGAASATAVLSLLDYIAVEYPQFVKDGEVVDAGEFQEQVEFSARAAALIGNLPDHPRKVDLLREAKELATDVNARRDATAIIERTGRLKTALIDAYAITVAPNAPPALSSAPALYARQCASCHGAEGRGDGPAGWALDPKPTNFHDPARQSRRSVQSLYATITQGVDGTAMAAFGSLPEADRWALAFHVSGFQFSETDRESGKNAWNNGEGRKRIPDMKALVLATPESVSSAVGDKGRLILAYLRSEPALFATSKNASPLEHTRVELARSLAAYREGNQNVAYDHAVSAYLEGFELAEAAIDSVDHDLRGRLEARMMAFRNGVRSGVPVATLEEEYSNILEGLASAGSPASGSGSSAQGQFASSFIIIVREGLEAILVLAGMAAFLVRTGRRDGLRYLHGGWVGALTLGGLTWWVASQLIAVSGAQREVTEGVTALLATGMLLYVGFWLHSKSAGQRWSSFIRTQVSGALGRKTLWGLAAISFLAVYREVFETVLFYQALLAQGSVGPVLAGFGAGCAVLIALALVIVRSTAKLPLGTVFGLSSLLLAIFAVVFAGRGVAALQAAGRFPTDPLSIPAVPWLGVYPTLQSVSVQIAMIVFIVAVGLYNSRTQPRQA